MEKEEKIVKLDSRMKPEKTKHVEGNWTGGAVLQLELVVSTIIAHVVCICVSVFQLSYTAHCSVEWAVVIDIPVFTES